MAKQIGYTFIDGQLTLVLHGHPHDVDPQHPKYKGIVALISRPEGETEAEEGQRADTLLTLVQGDRFDLRQMAAQVGWEDVKVEHGIVTVKGKELRNSLTERIVELQRAGLPFEPFVRFLINLAANPSEESREALFDFLEQGRFPLTDDGCFLGYKGVIPGTLQGKSTLVDQHSHSFDMAPGNVHEMPWDAVDNNRNQACGAGFHVGTIGHARGFGSTMIVVKVNPKDCVSVPASDRTKLRCCRYEVVNVFKDSAAAKELVRPVYDEDDYGSDDFEEEDNEYTVSEDSPESIRAELEAMSRDDICRKAAAEGLFASTNEARWVGKELVIDSLMGGELPFDVMTRDVLAGISARRHLFASENAALKAGRDAMIAAITEDNRVRRAELIG